MTFRYVTSFHGIVLLLLLVGCSHTTQTDETSEASLPDYSLTANELFSRIGNSVTKNEKDRAAILAMQGEHKVDFNFMETVVIEEGYKRFPPKEAGAFESVIVVENTPERIVLQHILVVGDDFVVKHWRQDWIFEAEERFEFTSDQTWKVKTIPAEKREGQWTQCVFEVSDAPRYCGTGQWNHRYGVSTWTSDRSWRPLPRREYTVREDYNALNVENRHTVTPLGWTHEQDNTKVLRLGEDTNKTLVREFGFNDYRRISGFDFGPAYRYWEKTAPYWTIVRDVWASRFDQEKYVVLNTAVDGMPVIEATFKQAEAIENGAAIPGKKQVETMLSQWVNNPEQAEKLTRH